MRRRATNQGMSVRAISGTHVVLLGLDLERARSTRVLGFAIEREDHTEHERYWLRGFKVFRETNPHIPRGALVSTAEHPIQSFVWNDLTAKPDHEYTYRVVALAGKPKYLEPQQSVSVRISTEAEDDGKHGIWMNRGVAGSQAYARDFGDQPAPGDEDLDQLAWLSRGLDTALLGFIGSAKRGDELHGALYEFHYQPVVDALAAANRRGVDVRIVFDAKNNEHTDKKGFHEAFPRKKNMAAVRKAHLPSTKKREENKSFIAHNKFVVLSHRGTPKAVWTGSTNISKGGIYGQANVGHLVHDTNVAGRYLEYWEQLVDDPLAAGLRAWTDEHSPVPDGLPPRGLTTLFSPRSVDTVLAWYTKLMDDAQAPVFVTAAFGVNAEFARFLQEDRDYLRYVLLESRPKAGSKVTIEMLARDRDNQIAIGSHLQDVTSLSRFRIEKLTGLNTHVDYMHTKFLVIDPLSNDPIVITGSANFSVPSNKENDENMLVIRGDTRVADIYLTEFTRLFQHFYFRYVNSERAGSANSRDPSFLISDPSWSSRYYERGNPKQRQRLYFR